MSPLPDRFSHVVPLRVNPAERLYAARDTVLDRDVWVKLPGGDVTGWSAPVRERLLREAKALAKVRHPAVVPVLWVEETAAGPLCVMEPPRGETLRERLAQGPLPMEAVLRLGIEIAEALAALHYHGVVHRGVGPRAIRLAADGTAQLADFTFAKDGRSGGMSSLQHGVVQKALLDCMPEYSAPEQMAGSGSEPRSDLYALGCTLYYCLTGVDAFAGDGNHEAGGDRFGALRDLPKSLVTALRSCTRPSKLERFSTGQQLADALRRVQAELAAAGSSVGRVGRQGLGKWVGALAGLAAMLSLAMSLWPQSGGARDGDVLDAPASADTDARAKKVYSGNYRAVHGLLVAIGEGYAIHGIKRKLNTPRADAEAIRERLRRNDEAWRRDGAIKELYDKEATQANFLAQLDRLEREAQPEDAVFVYFAGHAERDGRSFGLCAVDAGPKVEIGAGFVSRERLWTFGDRCAAKHVLVVLDSCHSGAVFDMTRGRDVPAASPNDRNAGSHHRERYSREFLGSCGANELASDGLAHSPFCESFLRELDQPATKERGFLAARFLAGRIAEQLDQNVRLQDLSYKETSEQRGSFVFRLAPPK
jgi:hypothetical protein